MKYTQEEVMQYVEEEDVKFIRMAFCDVFGRQRNVAVMADELPRAFTHGIAFDASAIPGFDGEVRSDLFLHPDPSTLTELPWRPHTGRVAHMFCDFNIRTEHLIRLIPAVSLRTQWNTPRSSATLFPSALRWNFIFSSLTMRENQRRNHMIWQVTWMWPRRTKGKMCVGKSA